MAGQARAQAARAGGEEPPASAGAPWARGTGRGEPLHCRVRNQSGDPSRKLGREREERSRGRETAGAGDPTSEPKDPRGRSRGARSGSSDAGRWRALGTEGRRGQPSVRGSPSSCDTRGLHSQACCPAGNPAKDKALSLRGRCAMSRVSWDGKAARPGTSWWTGDGWGAGRTSERACQEAAAGSAGLDCRERSGRRRECGPRW